MSWRAIPKGYFADQLEQKQLAELPDCGCVDLGDDEHLCPQHLPPQFKVCLCALCADPERYEW